MWDLFDDADRTYDRQYGGIRDDLFGREYDPDVSSYDDAIQSGIGLGRDPGGLMGGFIIPGIL